MASSPSPPAPKRAHTRLLCLGIESSANKIGVGIVADNGACVGAGGRATAWQSRGWRRLETVFFFSSTHPGRLWVVDDGAGACGACRLGGWTAV